MKLNPIVLALGAALAVLAGAASAACPKLLDHKFTSLQGEAVNLCNYSDRAILVVNTASKCGYTPQFEKLEGMYRKYKDKGLMVVGFPSNDFNQEPGSNQDIGRFCKLTYGVEFPMISKGSVTGADATPFYRELAAATGEPPQWNFHKYLIMPGAKQVYSFRSKIEPDSPQIMGKLEPILK